MKSGPLQKRLSHLLLCAAQFLDVFIGITIILPLITESLGADEREQQWILNAYTLTFGGLLLLFGRLTDLFGKKKGYLFGMFWLSWTSLYCGFAPSSTHLIIGRALQGIGAAANIPSAVGSITDLFDDPKERNVALSQFGAASPLGFITGLFISGSVAQAVGWRYVFFIYTGLTLTALVAAFFVLPNDEPFKGNMRKDAANIDYFGAFVSTASIILFIYAISAGTEAGWSSASVLAPLIVSLCGCAVFVWWERRAANPLIPPTFFNHQTTLILIMTFLVFFAFNGFAVFANLSLSNVYRYSTVLTAVHLIPMMVVGFATASATGYIVTRYPAPLPFLVFGHFCMIAACICFALSTENITYWALAFPALCLIVLGFDVIFNLFNILMMSSVAEEHRSFAGGMLNTIVQLGSGLGIAIEFTVANSVTAGSRDVAEIRKGYSVTFWIGAAFIALSLLLGVVFQRLWKIEHVVGDGTDVELSGFSAETIPASNFQVAKASS